MVKNILILVASVSLILLASCSNNDDNYETPQEWIDYQNKLVRDIQKEAQSNTSNDPTKYREIKSGTNNGSIYYMASDSLISYPSDKSEKLELPSTRLGKDGYPYVTDTAVVRYTGWLVDLGGKERKFDSTEQINGLYEERQFPINSGIIEGWQDMLQNMKEDQEVKVCIPYVLGYGANPNPVSDPDTGAAFVMPGYSTLFFRIKLIKVKPSNPKEVEEWNKEKAGI